jgi:DNA polymerase-3 subunit epsilon
MENVDYNYYEKGINTNCFAVIDLETTGFSPNHGDRIVEIGIVTIDFNSNEIDVFETLVNPKRAVTASHIHHITDEMVKHAPTFSDILGDISLLLKGKTIVGHNLRFDLMFLNYQMSKILPTFFPLKGLCTLELSKIVMPELPKRSLDFLCNYFDIKSDYSHSAISDCRATSRLFNIFKEMIIDLEGMESFNDNFCFPSEIKCEVPPLSRCLKRSEARDKIEEESTKLQSLMMRLPTNSNNPTSFDQYIDVLERAISDRILTDEESKQLFNIAKEFGMTFGQVTDLHKEYLNGLIRIYLNDNIIIKYSPFFRPGNCHS